MLEECEQFIHNDLVEMMEISMLEQQETTFSKDPYKDVLTRSFLGMEDNCGVSQRILKMNYLLLVVMIKISLCGGAINLFGRHRFE
jgi:hypothetical protein